MPGPCIYSYTVIVSAMYVVIGIILVVAIISAVCDVSTPPLGVVAVVVLKTGVCRQRATQTFASASVVALLPLFSNTSNVDTVYLAISSSL